MTRTSRMNFLTIYRICLAQGNALRTFFERAVGRFDLADIISVEQLQSPRNELVRPGKNTEKIRSCNIFHRLYIDACV